VIDKLRGRVKLAKFKMDKSKLKWPMLICVLGSILLALNGDYGYVPAEYCRIYPWITFALAGIPMLSWLIELELINRKYKSTLDEIRSKYGLKS
jgi:hypothetical protein